MSARSLATSAGPLDRSRATVSGFFRGDDHGGGIGDPGDCEANRQLLLSTHLPALAWTVFPDPLAEGLTSVAGRAGPPGGSRVRRLF